jgi:hypothetical protein
MLTKLGRWEMSMEHQEEYSNTNRAELIKLARESCANNLNSLNRNNRNKNSDWYKNPIKGDSMNTKKRAMNHDNIFHPSAKSLKLFLVRIIVALMLFLSVLLCDKYDLKFKIVNREYIQEIIATNQGIEDAENFVASVIKDFVNVEK